MNKDEPYYNVPADLITGTRQRREDSKDRDKSKIKPSKQRSKQVSLQVFKQNIKWKE